MQRGLRVINLLEAIEKSPISIYQPNKFMTQEQRLHLHHYCFQSHIHYSRRKHYCFPYGYRYSNFLIAKVDTLFYIYPYTKYTYINKEENAQPIDTQKGGGEIEKKRQGKRKRRKREREERERERRERKRERQRERERERYK